jgi:hypothetical protein
MKITSIYQIKNNKIETFDFIILKNLSDKNNTPVF